MKFVLAIEDAEVAEKNNSKSQIVLYIIMFKVNDHDKHRGIG